MRREFSPRTEPYRQSKLYVNYQSYLTILTEIILCITYFKKSSNLHFYHYFFFYDGNDSGEHFEIKLGVKYVIREFIF